MKKLLAASLVFACALAARADLTITQQLKQEGAGKGMDATLTLKVKGDKMRMDGLPQMSNIINLKSGDVTSLVHAQKSVITIPGETVKKMTANRSAENPKIDPPKATGKTETINGYVCEEYETAVNGAKVQLWLTKDLPAVEKLMKDISEMASGADPFQGILKDQKISGFPMRTVMEAPGAGKITMTVLSLSEAPLPETDFAVPADYKAMSMPGLPGTP